MARTLCNLVGGDAHIATPVGADDFARPDSVKRCHSEPVTLSLAWKSVPLGRGERIAASLRSSQ